MRELLEGARYVVEVRPLRLDEKARAQLDEPARRALGEIMPTLAAVASWQAGPLEAAVRSFAEGKGLKLGAVAQPLRAALTGRTVSPPVFDVMVVLGRAECLARIGDQAL